MPAELGALHRSAARIYPSFRIPNAVDDAMRRAARGRRLGAVAVGAAVAVLAVAGCSEDRPTPGASPIASATSRPSSSPTSAASPSPTDTAAVLEVYGVFWPVLTTFDRRYPEGQWRVVLGRFSVDPQLSQAIAVAKEQRRNGITLYGQPRPRTPQTRINSKAKATLTDCVDFSRSGQADAKTGQRKTVGLARTRVTLTLSKGPDGWRVSAVAFPGGNC